MCAFVCACVYAGVCVCVCVKQLLDGSTDGYLTQLCLAQKRLKCILAEGARVLSVTLSGSALFASWELLQFPSSLIVKVIFAICMWALAQQLYRGCQCIMSLVTQ